VAEKNTIDYLNEQFSSLSMNVEIDTFYFSWVRLKDRQILINGKYLPVQTAYINHSFRDTIVLSGEGYVAAARLDSVTDIQDKIVLSVVSNQVILLKGQAPKAVLVFSKAVFPEVMEYHGKLVALQISVGKKGRPRKSYNLVATYSYATGKGGELILTAHWDSQQGPGADDNASGTAVLVELARYFQPLANSLPYDLTFVALGAEEVGLIGSKAYILQHATELKNCLLNINIDGVGRGKKVYIEMKHPLKFTESDTSSSLELISTDSFQTNLLTSFLEVYRNSSSPAIYPKWLQSNIKATMKELHYRYSKASCCSGADHRSFAYLDIPVVYLTIISKGKNKLRHSQEDLPARRFIGNLEKTGNIVRKLILQTASEEGLPE